MGGGKWIFAASMSGALATSRDALTTVRDSYHESWSANYL